MLVVAVTAALAAALVAACALLLLLRQGRSDTGGALREGPPRRESFPATPVLAGGLPRGRVVRAGARAAQQPALPEGLDVERLRLEEWRRAQLAACGLDATETDEAVRAGIDAGRFRELVRRGCPASTALRILL